MHITLVNEKADFTGGAEWHVAELAGLLQSAGHRTTLLYSIEGWMNPDYTDRFDAAFPLADGRRQIEKLSPDLVYVHQLDERNLLNGVLESGVPTFKFFHDHHYFCPRDHKYTVIGRQTCTRTVGLGCYPCLGVVNRTSRWPGVSLRTVSSVRSEQMLHRNISGVIVGSRYMRDHVVAHGFEPDKVHHVPLFIPEVFETERAIERDGAHVLFVGALLGGKGLDLLIEAFSGLSAAATLSIVGDGPQAGQFRAQAEALGIMNRVTFCGQLDRTALSEKYRRATCLVLPSRSPETFGFTGPEALLLETPVVASEVGGVPDWLLKNKTGWSFPSGDVEALRTCLTDVIAHPEEARVRAKAGQAHCRATFSRETHLNQLTKLFVGALS